MQRKRPDMHDLPSIPLVSSCIYERHLIEGSIVLVTSREQGDLLVVIPLETKGGSVINRCIARRKDQGVSIRMGRPVKGFRNEFPYGARILLE
jgi:hypothetical protein